MHAPRARALVAVTTGLMVLGLVTAPSAQAAAIAPPVTITTQPVDTTVVLGTDAQFTAIASDSGSADIPVTDWYELVPGGAWAAVPAAAGQATLTLVTTGGATPDGTQVKATFDDGLGGVVTSDAATLTVQIAPVVSTEPVSAFVPRGTGFQLSAAATGSPAPTVQWQSATDASGPWTDVPNAVSTTLDAAAGDTIGVITWYRAVFTNPAGSVPTTAASITVGDLVPAPVSGLSVANTAPGVLTASWHASFGAGSPATYRVTLLDGALTPLTFTTVTAPKLTASFTALATGSYAVEVIAVNAVGPSTATTSATVGVAQLVQGGTLSASVLRPFRDGFQDTIVARATSNFAASGVLRILNAAGHPVRSYPLAAGRSWGVSINGRTAAGAVMPNGAYRAQFIFGRRAVALRPFTIATSQVGAPHAAFSLSPVFPVVDGYQDSTRLNVSTGLPATVSVVITNSRGVKVAAWSLSRRMTATIVWSGRTSRGPLPAGTYRARVTVKGGEGVARAATVAVAVSAKRLHGVAFTGHLSAANAYGGSLQGSCVAQGSSIGMWSSVGDDAICAFGAMLPASFGNRYANMRLYACSAYTGGGTQAAGLVPLDKNGKAFTSWRLEQGAGCHGGVFPVAALNGRAMYWATGNLAEESDYYWIDYFQVTCTTYTLS